MNLILDIGNSRIKGYLFEEGRIVHREETTGEAVSFAKKLLARFQEATQGISVSTRAPDSALGEFLCRRLSLYIGLDNETPLPIKNLYQTPETLGYDRIAGAVEAHFRFPDHNVLVIDAGTAITYDLVTAEGAFAGGNISPGMDMRFRALATFTGRLPQVTAKESFPLIGKTTEEAILAGVENGIIAEIDGIIGRFRDTYTDLQTVITGGDAFFFDKKLKSSIFVLPDLTAYGLNRILTFNAQQ